MSLFINRNKNSLTNKCIVLDLDETLLHTFDDMEELKRLNIFKDPAFINLRQRLYIITLVDATSKRGTGDRAIMWGVMRPGLREFLEFCFKYFRTVTVWTAGRRRYANAIVSKIFINVPDTVYNWDHCVDESGFCTTKKLKKIFREHPKIMNYKNTFILDDRIDNFDDNPDNGILIPPYLPNLTKESLLDDSDQSFSQLTKWLMTKEVMESKDVRELDKTGIFHNNY